MAANCTSEALDIFCTGHNEVYASSIWMPIAGYLYVVICGGLPVIFWLVLAWRRGKNYAVSNRYAADVTTLDPLGWCTVVEGWQMITAVSAGGRFHRYL